MSSLAALDRLLNLLTSASGRDSALDQTIAETFAPTPPATPVPPYTASVDRCLDLLHAVLPGWHWHLGYGASGVLPYALLTDGQRRFEATAPTVPLALLLVITEARIALDGERGDGP